MKLKYLVIGIGALTSLSCGFSEPTLCECLTIPEYSNPGSKYEQCKDVFRDKYGTSDPSVDQMRSDYYNCKQN